MNDAGASAPSGEFRFELSQELIAQFPPEERSASRMLLVDAHGGGLREMGFHALQTILQPGDLLVINDSRVLPARLFTRRADTGGRIELLLIEPQEGERTWLAMARPARRIRPGARLEILAPPDRDRGGGPSGEILEVTRVLGDGEILVRGRHDPGQLADRWGVMPLPPYIHRDFSDPDQRVRAAEDRRRYQTVYATVDPHGSGSVAAPTAGLHFTDQALQELTDRGITIARVRLHVGPGTFRPPDAEQIQRRRLHAERFSFPASLWGQLRATRSDGGRIIAVGTTSLRVLETVARLDLENAAGPEKIFSAEKAEPLFTGRAVREPEGWAVSGCTRLFIMPPDTVRAADGLLTNFHLPGSSLLMLVAAFLGPVEWRAIYREAVARKLRFYSYGDCMLALRK